MSAETKALAFRQVVRAEPAELFQAFTNSTALREWMCDKATVSPQPNGHIFLSWANGYYTTGHFTDLVTDRLVAFTWQGRDEPRPTHVRVTIGPDPNGTHLTVDHSGLGGNGDWEGVGDRLVRLWQSSLENLQSILETGEDLRLTRKPMLGILPAVFGAEEAARLGVPVSRGFRLAGVVPGQGAEAAGLRPDDVVVAIEDAEVSDLADLRRAISSRRAGEIVEVTFYRGAERRSARMTLSARALPVVPDTAAELAARVQHRYEQTEQALDEFLSTVTDLEASYKPSPEEWSVKQVMAHLIQTERFNQQWIDELIAGQEASYDGWTGNQDIRLNATVHAFPAIGDLAMELKRLNFETVAMLRQLPEGFVKRRRTYWRLATTMLNETYSHIDDHLNQMRAIVAAARRRASPG